MKASNRYMKLSRTLTVAGNCSVTIPLTMVPESISAAFVDDLIVPMPSCVPSVPDVITSSIILTDNPLVFGSHGQYTSRWALLITWQVNGPTPTRQIEWTVEGKKIG